MSGAKTAATPAESAARTWDRADTRSPILRTEALPLQSRWRKIAQTLAALVKPVRGDFNDLVIIADGPHITIKVNDHLFSEVIDNTPPPGRTASSPSSNTPAHRCKSSSRIPRSSSCPRKRTDYPRPQRFSSEGGPEGSPSLLWECLQPPVFDRRPLLSTPSCSA